MEKRSSYVPKLAIKVLVEPQLEPSGFWSMIIVVINQTVKHAEPTS